jgi:primosomal replication protein N
MSLSLTIARFYGKYAATVTVTENQYRVMGLFLLRQKHKYLNDVLNSGTFVEYYGFLALQAAENIMGYLALQAAENPESERKLE